mmetsp:Transcript_798/g.2239  ORF Transcript_798/g.2239 Transcript_798/m.2239 type:complete len:1225 (-) Transcript_798:393-4067(-)
MFIEELIVDGFKSYSTRVSVGPFDRQFNAITGLNGSGKSNILDAICFVLGISNLTQVRVGNLSELVYKQGQAGVTKASVTLVLNNQDKSCGPVGYEAHDTITITRQIVIGGRNRYLLNSHNVQQNQIQNLFHSVSLNVNNPHFLIMQGRITKVINMKPQETLSMIEEAAGTRMYENKKMGALKTLEKKQNKVDEINRLLAEEITPTLEKLQRERANYMLWMANNNEMERLERFCTAFEYVQVTNRLHNKNTQIEEMEDNLRQIGDSVGALDSREKEIHKETRERAATRDKSRSSELKKLEDEHSKLSKEIVSTESKLKNREADLSSIQDSLQNNKGALDDMRKQTEKKEKKYNDEKGKFDALAEQDATVRKDIEKAQWTMQALTAGMSTEKGPDGEGEGKSMREQLLAAQTRLQMLDSDGQKKEMGIKSLRDRIGNMELEFANNKKDGGRLLKEKSITQDLINQKQTQLSKLKFDPERYQQMAQAQQQTEGNLEQLQGKLDHLRAHLGGIDFNYSDPFKGFDRTKVKGVVSKLFHIKPDFTQYHRALEVCAGGRMFFVVVDSEETGKALLENGQLRRRVTIIPLNKIVDPTVAPGVVRQAKSIASGADLHLALEIIGFQKQVESAMKYVFGGYLVCDTPETAKQVTFHPNVRVRSVTKDGDLYDPAGTITGGSAPKGGNILMRLQELAELEKQVEQHQVELSSTRGQMEGMRSSASQYGALEQELKCKQHEFALIEDRISRSASHAAEQQVQECRASLANLEAELKALPAEKKALEKSAKDLEKEIHSHAGSREGRIKHLEQQVEKLKAQAAKHSETLDKQREKTEQANVELEVMRGELVNQQQQAATTTSGDSQDGLNAEVEKLRAALEKKRADYEATGQRLEELRTELRQLDKVLDDLGTELTANRQEKEGKELEHKRLSHKIQQLQKDDKEAHVVVARMEKQHPWIEKEKAFFGKKGTDFDFEANSYQESKGSYDKLAGQNKSLSQKINKKAMVMFEKAEQEYKDLLSKRDIILNDKCKIEHVIRDLDLKKTETLRRTWQKVNKDFDSIFGTLLPHTNAKLEPPQGMDPTEGLEIKVAFHGVWKQSLTELSGGQRSLLALSLVLALLLFKPAPMYILDEIDSALDLSHTQNIGHMIRTHFPHSQFVVVSLKEGMFNHANVLFRTRFIDGTSHVSRYAIRDKDDRVAVPDKENDPNGTKKGAKRKALAMEENRIGGHQINQE